MTAPAPTFDPPPLTPHELGLQLGLDASTLARLTLHIELLREWQTRMNLVGRSTLADPWRRHVLDSAQILPHLRRRRGRLVDIGSGAGFPGLVLAILGVSDVVLVEATQKKCAFLREVARATETEVEIRPERVETMAKSQASVVTARAVAPVADLLRLGARIIGKSTQCFFLKGSRVERELTDAATDWMMHVKRHPSMSHPEGVLLELRDIHALART